MRATARRLTLAATTAAALGNLACASALPPPGSPSVIEIDAASVDPEAAAERIAAGDRLWQLRPDVDSVVGARDAYLQAATMAPADVTPVVGAVRSLVWLADHEAGAEAREQLATTAVRVALECASRDADAAACPYWLALAIGVQADARRATALDGVKRMVDLLRQAIADDARQDLGGPHRVLARVLAQAPGWPTGPGDPDEAVEQARLATEMFPEYPPNWLALAEALSEAGDEVGGRRAAQRAGELALQAQQQGHPDAEEWLREAREGRTRR